MNYYCPICRKAGAFLQRKHTGGMVVQHCVCPNCRSFHRHRLMWEFLQRHTSLFDKQCKQDVLHFAPEPCISNRLKRLSHVSYITADIDADKAQRRMDIQRIRLDDGSIDLVLCSHVLEHVPDDRLAIRELYRVLRGGGAAVIMTRVVGKHTYENASITDPAERAVHFRQFDHVRLPGLDYADRLAEAGFVTKTYHARDILSSKDMDLMQTGKRIIFYAEKPR